MIKKVPKYYFSGWYVIVVFCNLVTAPIYAQYSPCAMNISGGGLVPGDGQPHCFTLNVSGFPVPLPPYGTPGQCCLEGIGVSITSQCSGDLFITATSPSGTSLVLVNHRGGAAANAFSSAGGMGCSGGGTSFSSYGNGSLTGAPPYITCAPGQGPYFIPDGPPAAGTGIFTGENINGVWDICVTVDNPSLCGGTNNSVNVSLIGIFGNSNSMLATAAVIINASSGTICYGDSAQLDASSPGAIAFTWSPAIGLNATTGSTVKAAPSGPTIYTVTAMDGSGATSTSSILLDVSYPPVLNTSSTPAACGISNGTITVIPSGNPGSFTYTWNTNPPQFGQMATGLAPGNYSCVVSNLNGCSATILNAILNTPAGSTSVSSAVSPSCNGSTNGSALAVVTAGTAPFSYLWSSVPAQSNANALNLSAGTYVVTVTESNGCTSTASVTLNNPVPVTVSASSVNSFCNNPTGMCSINPSGGAGGYSYSWNTVPVQTTAIIVGLGIGSYICTVTDMAGCSVTTAVYVDYFNPPTVTLDTLVAVDCHGNGNGSASVLVSGGALPYTYLWSTLPVQTSAAISNLPGGTYGVKVTDAAGCSSTITATITEPPAIQAVFQTTNSACSQSTGTAKIIVTGGTPPYSYVWNTNPIQYTDSISALPTGNYSCLITDANNCTLSANTTISYLNAGLVSVNTVSLPSCYGYSDGSAIAMVAGGTPPFQYAWSTIPQQTISQVVNLTYGSYIVTVTDGAGCTSTGSVIITQPTQLTAITNYTNNYCGVISALATVNVSGGTNPYTYAWTTIPVQQSFMATGLVSGSYICTVSDANGCILTKSFTISDLNSGSPSIQVTKPVSCHGDKNAEATVFMQGGAPPYTYQWNTQPSQTTQIAIQLGTGIYQVIVTDANGCSATSLVTLTEPMALSGISTSTMENCSGKDGSATVTISGGTSPLQYAWNTIPQQVTKTSSGLAAGNYSCVVTDAHQCTWLAAVTVQGTIQPVAAFSYSPELISLQNPKVIFTDKSLHAMSWLWNFRDPADSDPSNFKNPVHTFKDTGTYCVQLIVTGTGGCSDSVEQCLEVNRAFAVYVPNAFTPNNDGINDEFLPVVFGAGDKKYYLEIYNRWGEQVFQTTSPQKAWNGKNKGTGIFVPSEMYVWKLQISEQETGKIHRLKGQVMLVK